MKRAAAAWERFWFEPEETSTLALVRIAFGTLVLAWTLTLTVDAYDFFSGSGLLPSPDFEGEAPGTWGLRALRGPARDRLRAGGTRHGLPGAHRGAMDAAGSRGRVRGDRVTGAPNPFVFNSGDGLLKVIAFYMMLAPSGASLSLDRWRRRGALSGSSHGAPHGR